MDKRRNKILIWLTAWASLLLLVLYSPVGSPDLNNNSSNQELVTDGAGIQYSTNYNSIYKGNNKIAITAYSESKGNTTSYSINRTETESKKENNVVPVPTNDQSVQISKKSLAADYEFSGTYGQRKGSNGTSNLSNSGLLSTSSDLSLLADNNLTRQGGGLDNPIGTTDPGGDPSGPPIPIQDGWGFLLALALVYGIIKKSIFKG